MKDEVLTASVAINNTPTGSGSTSFIDLPSLPGMKVLVHKVSYYFTAGGNIMAGLSHNLTSPTAVPQADDFQDNDIWTMTRTVGEAVHPFVPPYPLVGKQLLLVRNDSGSTQDCIVKVAYTVARAPLTEWTALYQRTSRGTG